MGAAWDHGKFVDLFAGSEEMTRYAADVSRRQTTKAVAAAEVRRPIPDDQLKALAALIDAADPKREPRLLCRASGRGSRRTFRIQLRTSQ